MKRTTLVALVLGVIVSAIVIALYATRLLLPLETAFMQLLLGGQAPARVVSVSAQYILVVLLSLGSCWLVVRSTRRERLVLPLVLFVLELFGIAWVGLLFQMFFQPLPSVLATLLGFGAAYAYVALGGRSQAGMARELFHGRISSERVGAIAAGELAYNPEAAAHEVTAVVCDIANKHDLAEECSPAQLAELTDKFIRHATESFLRAGAYIETITGEGIVALFGFPAEDGERAEKATRHALELFESFEKQRTGRDESFRRFSVHVGIATGPMMFAPVPQEGRRALLAIGEPVELARRFCIANRFYGSHILIGPGTFEMASKNVVARPIDFLSGVDVRERHEIYEPLMLASEASAEQIARRDYFWQGVVLYREKRWAEAYTQFQKARGPEGEEDAPLQLYLRRLEPLALNLVETP